MSAKTEGIIRSLRESLRRENEKKTSGYDTRATIRRIEDGVAWVHIPGGVDETPVTLTIGANVGDEVQVRVSGGRAFLVGNASAPPTDNAYARQVNRTLTQKITNTNTVIKGVQKVVQAVKKIADNTNQYFWHTEEGTDTGAHITEIPQEEFLADPENGGGNLLARSNGIAVRDGLTELATFSASGSRIGSEAEGEYNLETTSNAINYKVGEIPIIKNIATFTPDSSVLGYSYYQNMMATSNGRSYVMYGSEPDADNDNPTGTKTANATIGVNGGTNHEALVYCGSDAYNGNPAIIASINGVGRLILTEQNAYLYNPSSNTMTTVDQNSNIECANLGVPKTLSNPTLTKSSGNSTATIASFGGYGKMRMLAITLVTSAAIPAGSNLWVGTLSAEARPLFTTGGYGFVGSCAVMGALGNDGSLTIRATGAQIPTNYQLGIYFTYFLN